MVPKIADFGLSRLFTGTHTQTTRVCIGTVNYMPPEYLAKRKISNKYDVFSLGIIIIEIMTGPMGFAKFAEESSAKQFVELVQENWKKRIGITSKYGEQDCQQVKRCLEIALSCVEADRNKRPTIRDIVLELKKTETNGTASFWDEARLAKIGQWGGVGGGYLDIEVAPQRLESLTIRSGEVIYSLEFSYSDHSGQQHTAGPWGGYGPNKGSYHHTIKLGPSEYLSEVSGTIGPFDRAPAGVITSLTFISNAGISHGPYGQAGLAKIGPWGGEGGSPWDIKEAPYRLESVTICSDIVVNSLEFSYHGHGWQMHTIGPWGGAGGSSCKIELGPSEFLTGAYGTTGSFTNAPADVVTSLTLVTNARSYGPFGQGGGIPFQVPMQGNRSIVGFFGRAGSYLNAIGVYVNPEQKAMEQEAGLTKIGPWGGTEGTAHHMDDKPEPHLLESIAIRCGVVIDSIAFSYSDHSGSQHTIGPWGGPGGNAYLIRLQPLEFVQGISGTFGPFGTSANVITSLTIATSQGRGYGPFGQGGGTPFNLPVGSDGCIVGFFGRAGSYLEAIGAYVQTY
ncbi:Mannose/glucose-specific lectin [Dichanthelium oligosanthes]|uniref:Mannose/glucose-specific lectin n=1 Tax=Dichanthelium oligosanthes TaxID=888268 RepID=A0A1E5VZD8_9POAL|nr:Mannose/glucose-specific lectin [Dichanthelium oligosanthes]